MHATKLVMIFVYLILSLSAHGQSEFSKLVVFGDSLSDTGNLAIVNFPPPYFENRISDGLVVADLLATLIDSSADRSGHLLGEADGFNYSVAGGNILGSDREDLTAQVTAYLDRLDGRADPDALYLVFMGGNDARGLRSITSDALIQASIVETLGVLEAQIDRLVAAGARAFIVPNIANIGRLPETINREADDPGITLRAQTVSQRFNQLLPDVLSKYKSNLNISLVEFDLYATFEMILGSPESFGFTSIDEGCFDPDELKIELECVLFGFERRPFFDQLHPSSATNRIIFSRMSANLPELIDVTETRTSTIIPIILMLLDD